MVTACLSFATSTLIFPLPHRIFVLELFGYSTYLLFRSEICLSQRSDWAIECREISKHCLLCMCRSGSAVNSVHQREVAQYSNFDITQTKTFTLGAHIYCTYFGTQGQMLCSMDAAKSLGLRASGWSLILLDYENVATGVVCSYWVSLVNSWCLVRHVLNTCRVGVRHISFGSNAVWSPVNQETLESSLQPVHVLSCSCSTNQWSCSYRTGCNFWGVSFIFSQIWAHYHWRSTPLD